MHERHSVGKKMCWDEESGGMGAYFMGDDMVPALESRRGGKVRW